MPCHAVDDCLGDGNCSHGDHKDGHNSNLTILERSRTTQMSLYSHQMEIACTVIKMPFDRNCEFANGLGSSYGWIFSQEAFDNSPSSLHGISLQLEKNFRFKQGRAIRKLATEYIYAHHLTYLTLGAASVLMHRFYMIRSIVEFNRAFVILGVLYIAIKGEHGVVSDHWLMRMTNQLISWWHSDLALDIMDKQEKGCAKTAFMHEIWLEQLQDEINQECENGEIRRFRETIHEMEFEILCTLGFQTHVLLPHPIVVRIGQQLEGDEEKIKLLSAKAYSLGTMSLESTLFCVMYPPIIVANACFLLANQDFDLPMMLKSSPGCPWYQGLDPSITLAEVGVMANLLKAEMEEKSMRTQEMEEGNPIGHNGDQRGFPGKENVPCDNNVIPQQIPSNALTDTGQSQSTAGPSSPLKYTTLYCFNPTYDSMRFKSSQFKPDDSKNDPEQTVLPGLSDPFPAEKYRYDSEQTVLPRLSDSFPAEKYRYDSEQTVLPGLSDSFPAEKYRYDSEQTVLPRLSDSFPAEKYRYDSEQTVLPRLSDSFPAEKYRLDCQSPTSLTHLQYIGMPQGQFETMSDIDLRRPLIPTVTTRSPSTSQSSTSNQQQQQHHIFSTEVDDGGALSVFKSNKSLFSMPLVQNDPPPHLNRREQHQAQQQHPHQQHQQEEDQQHPSVVMYSERGAVLYRTLTSNKVFKFPSRVAFNYHDQNNVQGFPSASSYDSCLDLRITRPSTPEALQITTPTLRDQEKEINPQYDLQIQQKREQYDNQNRNGQILSQSLSSTEHQTLNSHLLTLQASYPQPNYETLPPLAVPYPRFQSTLPRASITSTDYLSKIARDSFNISKILKLQSQYSQQNGVNHEEYPKRVSDTHGVRVSSFPMEGIDKMVQAPAMMHSQEEVEVRELQHHHHRHQEPHQHYHPSALTTQSEQRKQQQIMTSFVQNQQHLTSSSRQMQSKEFTSQPPPNAISENGSADVSTLDINSGILRRKNPSNWTEDIKRNENRLDTVFNRTQMLPLDLALPPAGNERSNQVQELRQCHNHHRQRQKNDKKFVCPSQTEQRQEQPMSSFLHNRQSLTERSKPMQMQQQEFTPKPSQSTICQSGSKDVPMWDTTSDKNPHQNQPLNSIRHRRDEEGLTIASNRTRVLPLDLTLPPSGNEQSDRQERQYEHEFRSRSRSMSTGSDFPIDLSQKPAPNPNLTVPVNDRQFQQKEQRTPVPSFESSGSAATEKLLRATVVDFTRTFKALPPKPLSESNKRETVKSLVLQSEEVYENQYDSCSAQQHGRLSPGECKEQLLHKAQKQPQQQQQQQQQKQQQGNQDKILTQPIPTAELKANQKTNKTVLKSSAQTNFIVTVSNPSQQPTHQHIDRYQAHSDQYSNHLPFIKLEQNSNVDDTAVHTVKEFTTVPQLFVSPEVPHRKKQTSRNQQQQPDIKVEPEQLQDWEKTNNCRNQFEMTREAVVKMSYSPEHTPDTRIITSHSVTFPDQTSLHCVKTNSNQMCPNPWNSSCQSGEQYAPSYQISKPRGDENSIPPVSTGHDDSNQHYLYAATTNLISAPLAKSSSWTQDVSELKIVSVESLQGKCEFITADEINPNFWVNESSNEMKCVLNSQKAPDREKLDYDYKTMACSDKRAQATERGLANLPSVELEDIGNISGKEHENANQKLKKPDKATGKGESQNCQNITLENNTIDGERSMQFCDRTKSNQEYTKLHKDTTDDMPNVMINRNVEIARQAKSEYTMKDKKEFLRRFAEISRNLLLKNKRELPDDFYNGAKSIQESMKPTSDIRDRNNSEREIANKEILATQIKSENLRDKEDPPKRSTEISMNTHNKSETFQKKQETGTSHTNIMNAKTCQIAEIIEDKNKSKNDKDDDKTGKGRRNLVKYNEKIALSSALHEIAVNTAEMSKNDHTSQGKSFAKRSLQGRGDQICCNQPLRSLDSRLIDSAGERQEILNENVAIGNSKKSSSKSIHKLETKGISTGVNIENNKNIKENLNIKVTKQHEQYKGIQENNSSKTPKNSASLKNGAEAMKHHTEALEYDTVAEAPANSREIPKNRSDVERAHKKTSEEYISSTKAVSENFTTKNNNIANVANTRRVNFDIDMGNANKIVNQTKVNEEMLIPNSSSSTDTNKTKLHSKSIDHYKNKDELMSRGNSSINEKKQTVEDSRCDHELKQSSHMKEHSYFNGKSRRDNSSNKNVKTPVRSSESPLVANRKDKIVTCSSGHSDTEIKSRCKNITHDTKCYSDHAGIPQQEERRINYSSHDNIRGSKVDSSRSKCPAIDNNTSLTQTAKSKDWKTTHAVRGHRSYSQQPVKRRKTEIPDDCHDDIKNVQKIVQQP